MSRLMILEKPPLPVLAPFIESLWYFDRRNEPPGRERILPSGTTQLLISLEDGRNSSRSAARSTGARHVGKAAVRGPHLVPFSVDRAPRIMVGVKFKTAGATPFFHDPPYEMLDQHVDLSGLWGGRASTLRDALLEAALPEDRLAILERALLAQVVRPLQRDRVVDFALDRLRRGIAVAAITRELGITPKRLIDRFRAHVGLTPKRFARLHRFQRLLHTIDRDTRESWAARAQACNYADEAHLSHEFRAFARMSPGAYLRCRPRDRDHVPE